MKRRLRARVTLFALAMTVAWMGVFITARTWSQSENQPETPEVNLQHQPRSPVHDDPGPRGEPNRRLGARPPWPPANEPGAGTALRARALATPLSDHAVTDWMVGQPRGSLAILQPQDPLIFTVNSVNDDPDAGPDGRCDTQCIVDSTLPCGTCTLRAALMEANASVGAVEILFDAALMNQTILPQSALPALMHDGTTIDALKDPSTGNQRPFPSAFLTVSGASAGAVDGFTIQADNCTIRGLAINGFGGHGINIIGGMNNMVKSNMIGTDRSGNTAVPNNKAGVFIGASAVKATIGGTTEAERHVISGNRQQGILVFNQAPREHKIQGNYIGTDATGQARIGGVTMGQNQSSGGIQIDDPESNTIGAEEEGVTVGEPPGNVIAYNDGPGLRVSRSSNNKVIGNRINNNARDGVLIDLGGTANKISQNSIFANGGTGTRNLGIDLVGSLPYSRDGVDTNDTGDGDTGPNNQQNFPVITLAQRLADGRLRVAGRIDTPVSPTSPVAIEFFNAEPDPSGFGEGKTFLGSIQVMTQNFDQPFSPAATVGNSITATAIDMNGNTSEFAANAPTTSNLPPSLTVLVPDGGEDWAIGSVQPIQWDPDWVTGDVKIELSRDGGSTFETLFASTANDGAESWTVTGSATTQALVKISSVDDPSINDLSDAVFTISQSPSGPSITVLVPNGGESWPIGSVQTIQWTSSGITSNVNIELSRDGGFRYTTIIARNVANTGTYQWTVTGPASSQCKIRVISLNPVVLDESDDVFSITP